MVNAVLKENTVFEIHFLESHFPKTLKICIFANFVLICEKVNKPKNGGKIQNIPRNKEKKSNENETFLRFKPL